MSNDLLIDVNYMLSASKRLEHKESVKMQSQSYILFLQEKDLTINVLLKDSQVLPDDFKLMESELTDLGVKFYDQTYLKWIRRIDNGADPQDTSFLEKAFKKMCKS